VGVRFADREFRACGGAEALLDLASNIEHLCYNLDGMDTPAPTIQALHKVQRVLKPTIEWYYGDESPLVWDPPSMKFQPKAKAKC
jgi:hypothetical protein